MTSPSTDKNPPIAWGESTISTMTGTCSTRDQELDWSNWPRASRPKNPRRTVAPASPMVLARSTSTWAAGGENQPALSAQVYPQQGLFAFQLHGLANSMPRCTAKRPKKTLPAMYRVPNRPLPSRSMPADSNSKVENVV